MPHPRSKASVFAIDLDAGNLAQLANDPELISGVHNYCDRWCERCPLTARCLVFRMSWLQKQPPRDRFRKADQQELWHEVFQSLTAALRVVEEEAQKLGIDLDPPAVRTATVRKKRQRRHQAARQGRSLHRAARNYRQAARHLLDTWQTDSTLSDQKLEAACSIDPDLAKVEIGEAREIVQWYLVFIDVKLQRAVSSRLDEASEDFTNGPSDSDGSAKIALVAIDRSIDAWVRLFRHAPEQADAILDLLIMLERLRRSVEQEFPHARAFKRPGFD